MKMTRWILAITIPAALAVAATGCAGAAVGAGAGAVAGIAYTDRGAEAQVKGDTADVNQRAQAVFRERKITQTETKSEDRGQERTLKGKLGDTDVTISMRSQPGETTKVEVIAQESLVKWDKDLARSILSEIVERG